MDAFVSLSKELDGWFEKPFDELPEEIRERVRRSFPAAPQGEFPINPRGPYPTSSRSSWDWLDKDQNRRRALEWDYEHDPELATTRDDLWDLQPRIDLQIAQLDEEIAMLEVAPPALNFDRKTRQSRLSQCRQELRRFREFEANLLSAQLAELPSIVLRGRMLLGEHSDDEALYSASTTKPASDDQGKAKRPFSSGSADMYLASLKLDHRKSTGSEMPRPTEAKAIGIIGEIFDRAPRDPIRKILNERWGPGKRGPRNSAE